MGRDADSDVPHIGQWVNWDSLKGAIHNDRNSNVDRRHQVIKLKDLASTFRLIDVAKRCIRTVETCTYVALSYVWGADWKTTLVALKHNIEALGVEGSLSDAILPRTIADAIKVCEQLDQEYLWVDRLCIIQDDAEDKVRQIGVMGKIFSSAELVIAVPHGESMNSGIPGVGYPRRGRQQTVTLPGLTVTNVVRGRFGEPLEVWRTRGWTYQEAVLARRLLLFYGTRVVYEGVQYTESEDRFDRVALPQYMISTQKVDVIRGPRFFPDYARHVRNYAARSLSFQIDTYAAFDGITQALYGQNSTHFALPLVYFDLALRWFTPRYVTKPLARVFGGVCFPTWSWTSMMNQECEIVFREDCYSGALVAWYKLDETEPHSLKALNSRPDPSLYADWETYMAFACTEGCIMDTWCGSLEVHDWAEFRNKFNTRWPNYNAFYEQLTTQAPYEPNLLQLMRQMPGAILGRSQVSLFSVTLCSIGIVEDITQLDIVDSDGNSVGALYGASCIWSELRENYRLRVLKRYKYEFVAISMSTESTRYPRRDGPSYADAKGSPLYRDPAVNVMLITWDRPVARRLGLGWIHLMNWAASDREWKTILLQ